VTRTLPVSNGAVSRGHTAARSDTDGDETVGARSARKVGLALCQTSGPPYEPDTARARSIEAATAAFEQGAKIVLLPELTVPGYGTDAHQMSTLAEPLDGPTVRAWATLARRYGGLIAGGFCERDGDAIYNTAVVVGGDGVALHYRKLHLFAAEAGTFSPGNLGLPVLTTPNCRIGICVCYDLRFVEVVRILALRGAELVLVPTAWVPGFDAQMWDEHGLAPQAHAAVLQANLSQVFIACSSSAGTFAGNTLLGSSIVADPLGHLICGPLPGDRDATSHIELDLDAVSRAQQRAPLVQPRRDRRTDVYALTIDGEVL
jgi:N-carbamoylputrescine amidase